MKREKCPCCSYPTLEFRNDYEICLLCDWEDDGQDGDQAAEVWGGPNGDYSLEEARINFKKNLIMYRDGFQKNSSETIEQKKRLMKAYEKLEAVNRAAITQVWSKILLMEKELRLSKSE